MIALLYNDNLSIHKCIPTNLMGDLVGIFFDYIWLEFIALKQANEEIGLTRVDSWVMLFGLVQAWPF